MHVVETRHVRRFVVRLEAGEDVVASLHRLCKADLFRAGWIRGRGVVSWADVASWDDARRMWRPARHLEGPFVLASLEGTITTRIGEPTVEIDASLVRDSLVREKEGGAAVLGGRLVAAAALNVEVLVEVFEDIRLERQDDDALGMAVWRAGRVPGVVARARKPPDDAGASPSRGSPSQAHRSVEPSSDASEPESAEPAEPSAAAAAPPTAAALSWAAVAEASADRERHAAAAPAAIPTSRHAGLAPSFLPERRSAAAPADDDAVHVPKRGDWIEHRQFGLCRVEGEAEDGTRVRLPSGARKTLRLDVLEVLPPRHEADRTVFPVRPRAK